MKNKSHNLLKKKNHDIHIKHNYFGSKQIYGAARVAIYYINSYYGIMSGETK